MPDDSRCPGMVINSDQPDGFHAAQIAASADLVPDVMIEVIHGRCELAACTRPDGALVRAAVTWLHADTPQDLQYKGAVFGAGHPLCGQIKAALVKKIETLLSERGRR